MIDRPRQEQFTKLLEEIQRQLFGYIFALVRNLEDAQEVYQQTCMVLWERFDDFAGQSKFATWACAIARNKVFDLRKRQKRDTAHFSQHFAEQIASLQMNIPAQEIEDRQAALDECLKKLSPHQRDMIRECYGRDMPVARIAEQMGRRPQSVHNTLRRLRTKLIDCIDRTLARNSHGVRL